MGIIDKIKQLEKTAAGISSTHTAYIGFSPCISAQSVILELEKGWWHLLLWGENLDTKFGSRIIPWLPSDQWPVYRLNNSQSSSIIAAKSCAAFPLIAYWYMKDDQEYINLVKENWEEYEKAVMPFAQILGCGNEITVFRKFLLEKANVSDKSELERLDLFKSLCLALDPGNAHTLLRETIDAINSGKNLLPFENTQVDDVWAPRFFHTCSSRIPLVIENELSPQNIALLVRAFDEPLCYDTIYHTGVSHYPDLSTNARIAGFDVAYKLSQVSSNKDFSAQLATIIAQENAYNFTGKEYMEAAGYFDEIEKDAKRAWNALVSGAYWSGQNTERSYLPFLEAAIHLCTKHSWEEARETLEHQLCILKN